jgi:exo-1,4-beta-D-glucosaminidase
MFESFAVNKFNSTGVVQWMYNSAWPTLYWQLFDYYLMPNGAFYGTKKASSPVLPIYNYGDHGIYVNNDKKDSLTDISLQIKIFDINSNLLFDEVEKLDIGPNQSKKVLNMPEVDNLSSTFFLDLRLMDDEGKSVENNFYWLSTKPDIPDFEKSTWYWTPNKQHADFKALNSIEKTEVNYDYSISTDKDGANFEVTIHNPTNKIAFFLEFMLVDKETNEPVLPVYWSDNYISLLPGEKRILTVAGNSSQFSNPERMNIVIQGFNLK